MAKAQIRALHGEDCEEKESLRLIPDLINDIKALLADAETAQFLLHARLESICTPTPERACADDCGSATRGRIADSLSAIIDRIRELTRASNEMRERVQV